MKIGFQKIHYSLPKDSTRIDVLNDQRLITLDQSLPDQIVTRERIRSCQYTLDLTLPPDHNKWGKSLAAQRVFFTNIARELISTELLKIRQIYMVFEVQVDTRQLHCHANMEFDNDTFIEYNIVVIKRALERVYKLRNVGTYVYPIKNAYDRLQYLLKVRTKQPGFLVHFERCADGGDAFVSTEKKE